MNDDFTSAPFHFIPGDASPPKRIYLFAYGLACYLVLLATFAYAVGFVGDLLVPRSIDSPVRGGFVEGLAIDLLLLAFFAVQHRVMARRGFREWITRYIPAAAERSTYVLATSLALAALFAEWRPLGGVVWEVRSHAAASLLDLLCALGWGLVLMSTLRRDHFDLFGLRQVYIALIDEAYLPMEFHAPPLYCVVPHPLYAGLIVALWCTPTMSMAHLLFATAATGYMLVPAINRS